jgi:hypothetical protein
MNALCNRVKEHVVTAVSLCAAAELCEVPVSREMTDKSRVLYHIQEYPELLDSSNMAMDSWIQIALDVQVMPRQLLSANIHNCNVMVVLYGNESWSLLNCK